MQDQVVSLESLNPQDAEFHLDAFPDVTFRVRKINLQDQVWIRAKFPEQDIIDKAFKGMDPELLSELIYHQLDQEGRKHFLAFTEMVIDDDGDKREIKVKGAEAFRRKIVGTKEFVRVFNALLKTIGISMPSLDNISVEEKKKEPSKEKIEATVIGDTSSTSSHQNTDGPLTT